MKNNKKGFTIVELVIVIAIIAILAAVLIPTFSNVIAKANQSAVLQAAKTKFEEMYADDFSDGDVDTQTTNLPTNVTKYEANDDGTAIKEFVYEDTAKGYKSTYNGTWVTEKISDSSSN